MDLKACLPAGVETLWPGEVKLVPCGFKMAFPEGYEAQVRSRSGLAVEHRVRVFQGVGTIDSDFRGEVKVILQNAGSDKVTFKHGDRIAQMVFAAVMRAVPTEVGKGELPKSVRGEGGWGS